MNGRNGGAISEHRLTLLCRSSIPSCSNAHPVGQLPRNHAYEQPCFINLATTDPIRLSHDYSPASPRRCAEWAERALEIDSTVKPPQRSEECGEACVAAMHNLGEIAALLGDRKKALERFTEALSLAKGLDMQEGIEAASEAIRRIEKAKKADPV